MNTDTNESLVKVDTTVGMDEVAAIKVAEIERACLIEQENLRAALKTSEIKAGKLNEAYLKALAEDARNENPEIEKLEVAAKKLFGKDCTVVVTAHENGKVTVTVDVQKTLEVKGAKSKPIHKELESERKVIGDIETGLCDVKKKFAMIPHMERSAKAAVARARLNQSEAGKNLLAHMDTVSLPGLPAPKK